jgi:hypothetical protein
LESARIERSVADGSGRAWRITLTLDIGVVTIPGTFRTATSAESVAREHAATLGFRVVGAEYGPSSIELELRRETGRLGESSPA